MCSDASYDSSNDAIRIGGLSKTYYSYNRPFDRLLQRIWPQRMQSCQAVMALKPLDLTIHRGETVAIIGRNGSGKSTLLQLICGTLLPSSGSVVVNGRISALLELGAGFNPEFTGRENVWLSAAIYGFSERDVATIYPEIVEFSGLSAAMDRPVKTYSSGMYVRLAFAVAVAANPDILIVDEALAVGDEKFQRKCYSRIRQIQDNGGTVLCVSHAASTVLQLCQRAVLLDGGDLIADGLPKQILAYYHKLLFAPPEQEAVIREEICQIHKQYVESSLKKNEPYADDIGEAIPNADSLVAYGNTACFDPNLIPETTVSYESQGAIIQNIRIETMSGERVNRLLGRQRYRYCYEVLFTAEHHRVAFAFMIKDQTGILLAGAGSHAAKISIERVKEGDIIDVIFEFDALLAPGVYFTNSGCYSYGSGEHQSLHRVMDACMFRVVCQDDSMVTGMVDVNARVTLHKR
jgi:lipopolysaccharide transport system ATP-binding protein